MLTLKELLRLQHANHINQNSLFTFSVVLTPSILKEIEEMGEFFTTRYQSITTSIPGITAQLLCISLKEAK